MGIPRSHAEILGDHTDHVLTTMKKCIPATVTAVYPAKMTVDVQVAVTTPHTDPVGNVYFEDAVSICDVPLGTMRGGKFFVWLPVAVGDSVLLLMSDVSTDTWRASPKTSTGPQPNDPFFVGKHTFDSCFAIPMFAPDAYVFSDPAGDPQKIIIGQDGGPEIKIDTGSIELRGASPAADHVALASKVDSAVATLTAAINTHTHVVAGVTSGPSSATATATTNGVSGTIPSAASTLVQCA